MEIKNQYEAWEELYRTCLEAKATDDIVRGFTVCMDPPDKDEGIAGLRYLFPALTLLYEKNYISKTHPLAVKMKFSEGMEADLHRARAFLSLMIAQLPYVRFQYFLGGSSSGSDKGNSTLFPLCAVVEKAADAGGLPTYLDFRRCLYWKPGEEPPKPEYPALAPFLSYVNTLLNNVKNPENYNGTDERKLKSHESKLLSEELLSGLAHWRPEMDILSQSIWLYFLHNLMKEKQLYTLPEAEGERPRIKQALLEKSRMDAVSYAEAIYQLIENACLHSQHHRGWFGCRIYSAGRSTPMSSFLEEANLRSSLYQKYSPCFTTAKLQRSPDNIFNKDTRFYFEFFVMDDSSDGSGIRQRYNSAIKEKNPLMKPCERIAEIMLQTPVLSKPADETALNMYIDEITVHYGLRLLRKIVLLNQGYLICKTPNEDPALSKPPSEKSHLYYFSGLPEQEKDLTENLSGKLAAVCYFTEWSAIIPLAQQFSAPRPVPAVSQERLLFGRTIEKARKHILYLDCDPLLDRSGDASKPELIRRLTDKLVRTFPLEGGYSLSASILVLQLQTSSLVDLELLSKALFAYIVTCRHQAPVPLRIALLLPSAALLHECLRLFSIFYLRGTQREMEGVQVAFCAYPGKNGTPQVNFVLNGATLDSAYRAALQFSYHNADTSLEYLPLIDYLTQDEKKKNTAADIPPFFPFDLFLPMQFSASDAGHVSAQEVRYWEDSWFLQHMHHRLERDMRYCDGGCKLEDVHIRLGSKLHLTSFFEGQLLFHDMGDVARFAYLLTLEITCGKDAQEAKNILLLGYEKYSIHLMHQVEYCLKHTIENVGSVWTAIVYDGEEEGDVVVRPCYDQQDVCCHGESLHVISVLPVGTTLSTIYKMHNSALERLALQRESSSVDFSKNFCLILVNQELFHTDSLGRPTPDSPGAVSRNYWKNFKKSNRTVTVEQEERGGGDITVKYLLPADAEWLAPGNCTACHNSGLNSNAVISAKHSNTMPSAIFTPWMPREGRFSDLCPDPNANLKRISYLDQAIRYSHLYAGSNHFQFYLDFARLFYDHQETINQDIQKEWSVPANAFHLVVSPLQFRNAPFIKTVLDLVFHGTARFLHIDLTDIYREETRTKFTYITEEFKRLHTTSPATKICIHFADTSIVTGSSLNRARVLVQMLLHQSGCPMESVELFSKIFLLVNRCSYDTLNAFVRDPRQDVHAYIHLAVPSYNTENGLCPACRLTSRYGLLEKRSATVRLSAEFLRLQEKHTKRTDFEYDRWLRNTILNSHTYLDWLKQWLYTSVSDEDGSIQGLLFPAPLPSAPKAGERDKTTALALKALVSRYFKANRPPALPALNDGQRCEVPRDALKDLVRFSQEQQDPSLLIKEDAAVALVRTYLVDLRAYMRLYAMQQAYEKLEQVLPAVDPSLSAQVVSQLHLKKTRACMLRLISGAMKELDKVSGEAGYVAALSQNTEWLISYIKVLSREQIANYYHCRQAIMGIMIDLIQLMGFGGREDPASGIPPLQKQAKDRLENEDASWHPVTQLFTALWNGISENLPVYISDPARQAYTKQMCIQLVYQLLMILLHRMADLQNHFLVSVANVRALVRMYSGLLNQYRALQAAAGDAWVPYFELPSPDQLLLRYLKSLKLAAMAIEDDTPCLALAKTATALLPKLSPACGASSQIQEFLQLCGRYIYVENNRMLYSGMRDLEQRLQKMRVGGNTPSLWQRLEQCRPVDALAFYDRELRTAVRKCLCSCNKTADTFPKDAEILYQNLLGNFCRFWNESTVSFCAEAAPQAAPLPSDLCITYLLQYFRRLNSLHHAYPASGDPDELPYLYEELCRIICGFTGFQMCYIAVCGTTLPQLFTQSGYYSDFMLRDKILTNGDLDNLQQYIKNKLDQKEEQQVRRLLPGIVQVFGYQGDRRYLGDDYLVVSFPVKGPPSEKNDFQIILQADQTINVFGEDPQRAGLRYARDILFLRHRLQEVLSRDYSILKNYRFDCSYIRPVSDVKGDPIRILHLSDLHVCRDFTDGEIEAILNRIADENNLNCDKGGTVDLLAITGDIVDGRASNAPQMEANYRYAEKLLTRLAERLWKDQAGYLPHDWRRRVMIITGNHDYAAMNQFKAILKKRALAGGTPVDEESGTMSKFAYFIDFLIRYLDPPVDELLRNDINDVRYYRNLGIKALMLNCSGTAVPRRTNKIGVNTEIVRQLLASEAWTACDPGKPLFKLCLAHYSSEYDLSYLLDEYDALPGWEWEPEKAKSCPINQLELQFEQSVQEAFCAIYRQLLAASSSPEEAPSSPEKTPSSPEEAPSSPEKTPSSPEEAPSSPEKTPSSPEDNAFPPPVRSWAQKAKTQAFMTSFNALIAAMEALESGKTPNTENAFFSHFSKPLPNKPPKDAVLRLLEDMKRNELFQQIQAYKRWLDKGEGLPEPISRLIMEVQECSEMSAADKRRFQAVIGEVKELDLYLAGHIHAYSQKNAPFTILVSNKLMDGENVCGYIITLTRQANQDPITHNQLVNTFSNGIDGA